MNIKNKLIDLFRSEKKFNLSIEEQSTDNKIIFDRYMNYSKATWIELSEVNRVNNLIKIIVEYLNYNQAINSIQSDSNNVKNDYILKFYEMLCYKLNIDYVHISEEEFDSKTISINEIPILLNAWKGDRVIDNFSTINSNNPFDGNKYSFNIFNSYIYPLNIVVCRGGNHSQLSARYQNLGKTIINSKYDFSILYEYVEFDGINFINKKNNEIIDIEENNFYTIYIGILFELGRKLLKEKPKF